MPVSPLNAVVQHLLTDLAADDGGVTDGELLTRFIRSRDEDALAPLIRRHAGMVWSVCRRSLHHHDAEDAFQATFLVLVRKAQVVPMHAVANWLYGVARQTAVRVQALAAKRGRREMQVMIMPEPNARETRCTDSQDMVDEALSRLPDRYRGVIVLCDLEGLTRRDAARQLGIPEGSVASRLARARAMLARRLTRQGIALSGSVAVFSAEPASASASPALVAFTIELAAGRAAVSAAVAGIAKGVMKTMFASKLKIALTIGLTLAFAATGVAVLADRVGPEPDEQPVEAAKPVLLTKANTITAPVVYKDTMLVLVSKTGVAAVVFTKEIPGGAVYKYRYESVDGKTQLAGDGRLDEKNAGPGKPDPHLEAGPISLRWSYADDGKGWVYYDPSSLRVNIASAKDFDDRLESTPFDGPIPVKKIDLKNFMQSRAAVPNGKNKPYGDHLNPDFKKLLAGQDAAKAALNGTWEYAGPDELHRWSFSESNAVNEVLHRKTNTVLRKSVYGYHVNPQTTPPEINLHAESALILGIYRVKDGNLMLAYSGASGLVRPKGFNSEDCGLEHLPLNSRSFKRVPK